MTPSTKLQALLEAAATTGAGFAERQLIAAALREESGTASSWWRQTCAFVPGEQVLSPEAVVAFARALQHVDDDAPEQSQFITTHTAGPYSNPSMPRPPSAPTSAATVTADVRGTVISIGDSRYAYQPPQQPMSAVHAAYEKAVATGAVKFRN